MELSCCFDGLISGNLKLEDILHGGFLSSSSSSLVLDQERGELVRAMVRPLAPGKKEVAPEKVMAAMRNHSEAERRRRERINGHLSMLRSLIPGTNKMDKASLLTSAIEVLKDLRMNASDATKDILVPTDVDEVTVERLQQDETTNVNGSFCHSIKASLCCDYKHEILSDLKRAFDPFGLRTRSVEMATFGGRMINVFVMNCCCEGDQRQQNSRKREECLQFPNSIRQTLKSVLDKFYASEEFSSRNEFSNKRRRVNPFGSTNVEPPHLGDFWKNE